MTARAAAPDTPERALMRMIAARTGTDAICYIDPAETPPRVIAATDAVAGYRQLIDPEETAFDWSACLAAATEAPLDLTSNDGTCAQVIAMPVRMEGHATGLLVALGDRIKATPALTDGLREGAELLALLPATAPRALNGPMGRHCVLPRADACRLIEARQAGTNAAALLLIDIDRFSAINAVLGFPAGDSLLAITATRLARSIGPREVLSRLESDRFLVLSDRPAADLPELARKLADSLGEPIPIAGEVIVLQATLGLVTSKDPALTGETLLMQAENALRSGKNDGGNRLVRHEARAEAAVQERCRLELDLGQAIDLDQMRLVYQPYLDLASNRPCGVEALLRWDHPQRGELQPAAFISMAERTGQILPVGDWTLRRALEQAADWPDGPRLSVNISALQFRQPDFTRKVDAALAATGFPAERLELEITETVLMRDNPETIGQLRTLINRGVRIALDDFGTGYSALAYLARLPHHRIKLDRCFVQDLANPCTTELIRAIIVSARAQGIAVTAEGVETPEQLSAVRRMGFTHAQGFATGSPVADPSALWRVGQHEPA